LTHAEVPTVRVVLNENIVVKGSLEYIVRARVQIPSEGSICREGVFVGNKMFINKFGVLVANSLVDCCNEFIPVRLMFESTAHAFLPKGTHVGDFHPLNDSIDYSENIRSIDRLENSEEDNIFDVFEKFKAQLSKLPGDQEMRMKDILLEFKDVFSKSKLDLGYNNSFEHRIETGSAAPIACAPRRVPVALEDKVDQLVQQLLQQKIIQPSESPWNSPIVVVSKKNGDVRMCVDYRRLNAVTKRPIFPIPDSQQICDTLHGSKYFSTIDLSQGYYQIAVAEEDQEKTAFSTRTGQFEFLRMPFGLCSAPATFQRMMHKVLAQENWEKCLIYIDDVLIYGRSAEEHYQRLRSVLQRIREAGLKLSPEKCTFMQQEVEFLGHIISQNGLKTSDSKIEKILQWPKPINEDQLRSFLGLCGYYRRFIKNYCYLAAPLEKLCQNSFQKKASRKISSIKKWEWNDQHEENFKKLKHALVSAPVLSYPTRQDRFILDTDACHDGIGAVLAQIQDGQERVIAYASHKLSQSERQYCITRKELLAVYRYVNHFKHYLYGRQFTIRTDHRALVWMLNWKRPSTSQYCSWIAELENYDFEIVHRPGKEHTNADALSRLESCEQCELKHDEPKRRRNVKLLDSNTDNEMKIRNISVSAQSKWNQEDDHEIHTILKLLKGGKLNERCPKEISGETSLMKKLWSKRQFLRIRGGLLYLSKGDKYALIVPAQQRRQLTMTFHQSLGHLGIEKVLRSMKEKFYWPGMSNDTRLFINTCKECRERKVVPPRKHSLERVLTGYPFEKVAIDIAGPLTPTKTGHKYILAIIDYFSKFPMLIPLKQIDSKTVAESFFFNWVCLFGVPNVVHTDRGSSFESDLFHQMCRLSGISKTKTAPYFPQSDGLVERLFRTVKEMVHATTRCFNRDWNEVLPIVEMGLRSSIQRTTQVTPYEVLFGTRMITPVEWQYLDKYTESREEYHRKLENPSDYVLQLRIK
jgi:hypothetical protein